jgi:2-dehydro-3-deoxyphosphogluconate aldolase/(4S)-4-hydroxy-2-oxoglutarate aldolase
MALAAIAELRAGDSGRPGTSGGAMTMTGTRRQATLADWKQQVIMPIIRTPDASQALAVADTLRQEGITLIEIAWNCGDAAAVIAAVAAWPGVTVGAGTLLDAEDANAALAAGAGFLVSPVGALDVLDAAHAADVPCALGAATPTEVLRVWRAGTDLIKLFPIAAMGGTQLIKDLNEPFGRLPWLVSGSVSLDNAASYLDLGAQVLALGGSLMPKAAIAAGDMADVALRARQWRTWLADRQDKHGSQPGLT